MNTDLRIDPNRMLSAFDELAAIGSTGDGGVHRPTFSEAHLAARARFRQMIEAAGLSFRTDGAGNHSAFLPCGPEDAPTLLIGSHLDSVPNGGRFDGALGVMAALEVLRTVKDHGLHLNFHLEAIDFTDEEGTLVGLLGSSALAGRLYPDILENPRGGREQRRVRHADAADELPGRHVLHLRGRGRLRLRRRVEREQQRALREPGRRGALTLADRGPVPPDEPAPPPRGAGSPPSPLARVRSNPQRAAARFPCLSALRDSPATVLPASAASIPFSAAPAVSENAARMPAPTGHFRFGSAGLAASGPAGSTAR